MDTTNVADGRRYDIAVELVSRRVVDCGGELVRRLLVATEEGEQFALFVPPGGDSLPDVGMGTTYRLEGVLGCVPPDADGSTAEAVDGTCAACGGGLRRGRTVDAFPAVRRAMARLDPRDAVGVVDDRTRVLSEDRTAVDDWRPMRDGREPAVPSFACRECGRGTEHPGDGRQSGVGQVDEMLNSAAPSAADGAVFEDLGLAAGGAKDVENFRENVRQGYTPQPGAISEEGLFYDYHFESGGTAAETDGLFAPRYAGGASEHPLTRETERYLSVDLDSTLSTESFERPRLDLVAVLDVSGSMDGRFDGYYYDEQGRRRESEADATTKLEAATRSLRALTEQLRDDDRLGVVLFNNRSHVAKPLRDVGETDMAAIRGHVRDVVAGGGTNMADGFEAAVELLAEGSPDPTVERRVVVMTDAMPNVGATDGDGLASLFADAAADGIHTTFVGVGIDANADLVDSLSGVRGANHYFVHSAASFERRLGEEFDYMVTPLVYDLALELETDGYEIAAVHGSPSADAATGRLLHVGTLFPAPKEDGDTRGGVVLVRVERTGDAAGSLDLLASWTERGGGEHTERVRVDLPEAGYDHDGVRTAVALTRYARLLRSWADDVHRRADRSTGVDDWLPEGRGDQERESVPLAVPDEHAGRLAEVRAYLSSEAAELDVDFGRELAVLDRILDAAGRSVEPKVEG